MNAAVRAVVRTGRYLGCNVFFVQEGYDGLVTGQIVTAHWESVSAIIQKGGTIIGSARCMQFRTREGRLKAAKNLVNLKINNLVVIGGDGSLTGANMFRSEWSSLLTELLDKKEVDSVEGVEYLRIIGIVGSIDNDFCGTDMTIGTDSALHRILEAIDAIICTAYSHQRTFIMEVMGRRCGYLALCAGLFSTATAVFIPEEPAIDWENKICSRILQERESGQRLNIIIVAEGAIDGNGEPISCEMVKEVVQQRTKADTRVTVLGHIQRGGSPSAFDRILASRMGVEAVLSLLDSAPDSEAKVITLNGTHALRLPLMQCVEKTQAVAKALDSKQYELAVKLRGRTFMRRLEIYKETLYSGLDSKPEGPKYRIALLHIGAPACGMNACVQAFVRTGLRKQLEVFGVTDGLDGLISGNLTPMSWADVAGWVGEGGALLGTQRSLPNGKFKSIADQLRNFQINGIFIVGGFEAFQTAVEFMKQRKNFKEFCIPILVAPATISNNVPGCSLSLGSDTALNEIVEICDRMRQSAQGTKRRVFICETMGGYCGYLATLAGLAGGADAAYIYEEMFSIKDLQRDLYNMASKMTAGVQRGLILRNEKCNDNYNCEFMVRLYSEEGKGIFSARSNIIGHMQQGRTSSPFDRNMGLTFGMKGVEWFSKQLDDCSTKDGIYTESEDTVCVLGIFDKAYKFSHVAELAKETDFQKHLPSTQWWLKLRPLLRILAKHESTYKEGSYMYYEEPAISGRFTSGIGLAFTQNGQRKEKMIDLFNLTPETNLKALADDISQNEPLITEIVKPKLYSLLCKLQVRLQKELNVQYANHQTLHHDLPIASVALNKDGTKCITGSFDNTCKVWDTESGVLDYTISSHTAPVYVVTFNHPYGNLIITGSFDKSACITNAETGVCLKTLWGHTDEIVVVRYDPNEDLIATASMDKTAKVYNVEKGQEIWTLNGHEEAIVSLHFSQDGRNILTGSFDSNIYLWDLRTQRKVASFVEHKEEVSSCLFNFDCSLIGSGSVDKTAKLWDLRSDTSVCTMDHNDEVLDVTFDCTGKKFATAGTDGLIKVFDASLGQVKLLSCLVGHSKEVSKILFSPGGSHILSGSADGTCRLWTTEGGHCSQILTHKEDIFTCLFSYDGSIIATAANDSACKLWKECESRSVEEMPQT